MAPIFRFGSFVVDAERRALTRDGVPARLGARALDTLLTLIERRDRIVTKSELLECVWRGLTVEEGNLQVQINALRKHIGAEPIATVPGLGYRFVASVVEDRGGRRLPPALALPPFFGRDDDLAEIVGLLRSNRLVTLVGAGGVGKTRLAQAVARAMREVWRDGVWLVELSGAFDPELVAPTVARALGLAIGARAQAAVALAEALRGQRLLLVLDNCEQIAAAAAQTTAAIHAQNDAVAVLATSQIPLELPYEVVRRVEPLAIPASDEWQAAKAAGAVTLFVARAHSADGAFELTRANVAAVAEICRTLDGVPLALELAAARVALLGVEGVRRRLGERLNLLAGGKPQGLARHRSLRAALEWSYGLLNAKERSALDRLGMFVGGFGPEAALALISGAGTQWAALDVLAALREKSLVSTAPGEPPRHRLLESTRVFALENLAASGELESARRDHAAALIATFQSADPFESVSARLARTAPELDNLRAAIAWASGPDGDRRTAVELFGEADHLWVDAGAGEEAEGLFQRIEPWAREAPDTAATAQFWLTRASLLLMKKLAEGASAGLRAAAIYRALGNPVGCFRALVAAAAQFAMSGNYAEARKTVEEARSLLAPNWPAWTAARCDHALGFASLWNGEPARARDHFRQALALYRRPDGDEYFAMQAWMNAIRCEYDLADYVALERGCRDFLAAASEVKAKQAISTFTTHISYYLGVAELRNGRLHEAETTLRYAVPRLRRVWGVASWTFGPIAYLLTRQERFEDAGKLLGWMEGSHTPGMVASSSGHRRAWDEAKSSSVAAIGADALARLMAEGRLLNEETAVALAFPSPT